MDDRDGSSVALSQPVEFPSVVVLSFRFCFLVASSFGFKRMFYSWRPCSGGAERNSRRGGSAYGPGRRVIGAGIPSPAAHTDLHQATEQCAGAFLFPVDLILAFRCASHIVPKHSSHLRAKLLMVVGQCFAW